MTPYRLVMEPPFDAEELEQLVVETYWRSWEVAGGTMYWLLEHQSAAAMKQAIVAAWRASPFPLREWAARIEHVVAWRDEDRADLGLEVHVADLSGSPVIQYAPLAEDVLQELLPHFEQPVPNAVVELGRAAPGLCIAETGVFAMPISFYEHLGYVRRWCWSREGGDLTEEFLASLRAPDPAYDKYLIEVGSDHLGNRFVLDQTGRLHLFDHEEPEFRACKPSFEELLSRYFEDPQCIYDNDFIGA